MNIKTIAIILIYIQGLDSRKPTNLGNQKCSGNLKMKMPDLSPNLIKDRTVQAKIVTIPKVIETMSSIRYRYVAYCYEGGAIDKNSGCEKRFVEIKPTKEERMEWKRKSMCKIGHLCDLNGNCWGSDAAKCLDDSLTQWVNWQNKPTLGVQWKSFAYHTCTSRWFCEQKISNVPINYQKVAESRVSIVMPLPNGTIVEVRENGSYEFKENGLNYQLDIAGRIVEEESIKNITCLQKEESLICLVGDNGDVHSEKVVTIDLGTLTGFSGDIKVEIQGHIDILSVSGRMRYQNRGDRVIKKNPYMSTAIRSTEELINSMMFVQRKLDYNDWVLSSSIHEISVFVLAMLSSISKIDDNLLGSIFNDTSLRSQWINEEVFRLCKRANPSRSLHNSNCRGDLQYLNGRYNRRTKPCLSYNPTDVKEIHPIKMPHIELRDVSSIDVLESHYDLDGWSWITDNVLSFQDLYSQEKLGERIRGESNYVIQELNPFGLVWKFAVSITTPLCIVTFILVVLRRN